jgi:tetratricopeptide (TPR) repeat protein
MRATRRSFLVIVCFLLLGACARPAAADSTGKKVYQSTLRGTVFIEVRSNAARPGWFGTGWVVDRERRLIVTNHHVVGAEAVVHVYFPAYRDGRLVAERAQYRPDMAVRAEVLDSDPTRDLGVIRVDSLPEGTVALKLAAVSPEPGEGLHLVGNPAASDALWIYSAGTVRSVHHKTVFWPAEHGKPAQTVSARVIESAVTSNGGDSGGPVMNDRGELVGVHSMGGAGQVMVRHIDLSEVKAFLGDVHGLLDPAAATAAGYCRRGFRYQLKGLHDKAIADFSRALEKDRNLADAYRGRGRSFTVKGAHDSALADCDEAVRLAPNDFLAWNERGHAHHNRRSFDLAVRDYSKAIELRPGDAQLYANRGATRQQMKAFPQAIADFTEALRLNPAHDGALRERGWSRLQLRQHRDAEADFAALLRRNPNDANATFWLGAVHEDAGQIEPAEKHYRRAMELDRNFATWTTEFATKHLRVANRTGERLTVSLQYETLDASGQWVWKSRIAGQPGQAYTLEAGQELDIHDGNRIAARRVRIWAVSDTRQWLRDRDQDVWLLRGTYRLRNLQTLVYTFQ